MPTYAIDNATNTTSNNYNHDEQDMIQSFWQYMQKPQTGVISGNLYPGTCHHFYPQSIGWTLLALHQPVGRFFSLPFTHEIDNGIAILAPIGPHC